MSTYKKLFAIVAVCAASTACATLAACAAPVRPTAEAAAPSATRLYSVEELQADLKQFRRIVERKAVGIYADRTAMTRALSQAERAVAAGPMDEAAFYRLLAPALAALRCGHSFLDPSPAAETRMRAEGRFFPLTVRSLNGRLYAVADPYGTGTPPGSELVSINGRPAAELFSYVAARLTTDGLDAGRPRYDAERWFAAMLYLFVGEFGSFDIEYLPPGAAGATGTQAVERAVIQAVRDPALAKKPSAVIFDTVGSRPSHSFREGYAYLKIPIFGAASQKAYESYLADFFAELKARGYGALVLDLRGNYGGSPPPTAALFRYLIDRPLPFFGPGHLLLMPWRVAQKPAPTRFDGRLYVLMDEAGFSMNGFLLALLKYHGIGTLVGAPSSGGYRCSDSSMNEALRATGIRVRYSTAAYEVAVRDMQAGIGVAPDLLVHPTLDDYLSGRDYALEAALTKAGIAP
jgi:hypothetical protein